MTLNKEVKKLWDVVGGLSTPSKMPGFGYGLPARECKLGSILRKIKDTVCFKCYAMKGHYAISPTIKAQYRRFEKVMQAASGTDILANLTFTIAFAKLLKMLKETYFRWHDSGDLQSSEHLRVVADIAIATPEINHWLPTLEVGILREYFKRNLQLPENLIVRVSAVKLNHKPDLSLTGFGSRVFDKNATPELLEGVSLCEAYTRGGKCGDCRKCWDTLVPLVGYPLH